MKATVNNLIDCVFAEGEQFDNKACCMLDVLIALSVGEGSSFLRINDYFAKIKNVTTETVKGLVINRPA